MASVTFSGSTVTFAGYRPPLGTEYTRENLERQFKLLMYEHPMVKPYFTEERFKETLPVINQQLHDEFVKAVDCFARVSFAFMVLSNAFSLELIVDFVGLGLTADLVGIFTDYQDEEFNIVKFLENGDLPIDKIPMDLYTTEDGNYLRIDTLHIDRISYLLLCMREALHKLARVYSKIHDINFAHEQQFVPDLVKDEDLPGFTIPLLLINERGRFLSFYTLAVLAHALHCFNSVTGERATRKFERRAFIGTELSETNLFTIQQIVYPNPSRMSTTWPYVKEATYRQKHFTRMLHIASFPFLSFLTPFDQQAVLPYLHMHDVLQNYPNFSEYMSTYANFATAFSTLGLASYVNQTDLWARVYCMFSTFGFDRASPMHIKHMYDNSPIALNVFDLDSKEMPPSFYGVDSDDDEENDETYKEKEAEIKKQKFKPWSTQIGVEGAKRKLKLAEMKQRDKDMKRQKPSESLCLHCLKQTTI